MHRDATRRDRSGAVQYGGEEIAVLSFIVLYWALVAAVVYRVKPSNIGQTCRAEL
jgi:hypothetical protein